METVYLEAPDGRLIEAKRLKNPQLEIDTWGFDCPKCHTWGVVYRYKWTLDSEDRLTVARELECRSFRCDFTFRVHNNRIKPT